jgi:peptidoglycan/LPS O-acetylase OafA/YrhL
MSARGVALPSLTGARAVAALGVFVAHLTGALPEGWLSAHGGAESTVSKLLGWGTFGVPFFFVLSGFVLAWTWTPRVTKPAFLQNRLARIWPVYIAVWLAFLGAAALGAVEWPTVFSAVASFFLVQAWVPGRGWANAVNPVAWTLSCEAFFYLIFPFLISPAGRMTARALAVTAAVVGAAGFVAVVVVLEPRGITVSTFPPVRAVEFVLGMLAGVGVRRGVITRSAPLVALVPALVATLLLVANDNAFRGVALALQPWIFAAMICRLAHGDLDPERGGGGLLATTTMRFGGEISYAFYLLHPLPLALVLHVVKVRSWASTAVIVALCFASTVLAAWALHVWIERPLASRLRYRPIGHGAASRPEAVAD